MRRNARVDANQREVIAALRAIGASVQPLHMVGRGCPDLLCGFRGKNVLLELKDGEQPVSRRRLTEDELKWSISWRGQVNIATSAEEAINIVTKHGVQKG